MKKIIHLEKMKSLSIEIYLEKIVGGGGWGAYNDPDDDSNTIDFTDGGGTRPAAGTGHI